jgi:glycosyltransferase involved in cell wall biosynthesis
MKILMYGWEFPPLISGGLGVACYGIVQSLLAAGAEVELALPNVSEHLFTNEHLHYLDALSTDATAAPLAQPLLQPYLSANQYLSLKEKQVHAALYGKDLWEEVHRYAETAGKLALNTPHDIIHAHDWLTILAGMKAKQLSHKPLVFHVHALEVDRCPQHIYQAVYDIEKLGLEAADRIIAVSQYTKNIIIEKYGIAAEKISVVYNGLLTLPKKLTVNKAQKNHFTVLFLGRLTEQKGPYYFIKAAEKVLSVRQDVEFVLAGDGDQLPSLMQETARLDISQHIHFTGFLNPQDVEKIYQLSDIYVMPSVSEPFGISCLEAVSHQLPVIISKQSGVSEVLSHALKVDYWDTDKLAANILALLEYPALKKEMLMHSHKQLAKLTWDEAAKNIISVYNSLA